MLHIGAKAKLIYIYKLIYIIIYLISELIMVPKTQEWLIDTGMVNRVVIHTSRD